MFSVRTSDGVSHPVFNLEMVGASHPVICIEIVGLFIRGRMNFCLLLSECRCHCQGESGWTDHQG